MHVRSVFATVTVVLVSAHAAIPEIVDEISPEVKQTGGTARLNCTVINKQNNAVTWTFEKTSDVISEDQTIKLPINKVVAGEQKYEVQSHTSKDRTTFILIIRRLREIDAGFYVCTMKIQGIASQSWPRKRGNLTVLVAPKILLNDTTAVLKVEQGTNSALTCAATGIPAPHISWARAYGGRPLPTGNRTFRGETLPFYNITLEMSGLYMCVADNLVDPPALHRVEVFVFHKPMVEAVQDSVGQAQNRGFSAKLECNTQGYPAPSVRWERTQNNIRIPIIDDDKFDISNQTTGNPNRNSQEQRNTLKVKNVQANDYTNYYCIATNSKGSDEKNISLVETTECEGPDCPALSTTPETIECQGPGCSTLPIGSSVLIFPSVHVIAAMAFFQSILCLHNNSL